MADIKISANNGEQRIVVPDPVDGSKAPYDMYMDSILTGIGGTDGAIITVSMPAGGRVTRIFVHQIQLGNHTVIQIVYRTPQEDGSVVEVPVEKYAGNLLFYTDHDINIKNTDNSTLLGTYVSTGRIYLQSNINFAGQLIANELVVGNEFDGRSFVFVPIDPPVLDLKPQADTPLEFPENDLLVKVPIALDTPAPADVFIDYCFDLQNSSAKESDFKLEDGYSYPKSKGHLFPICGQDAGKVTILKDAKTPADAPDVSVWINVAKDEEVERPNETLRLKITNISGAVLPGNKLDGYFDLIIVDANIEPTSENFEIIATEDEVFTFDSSMFKYESAFDKVEQGVVITSLPEKGFLLSNGDTLTNSDLNKFIPINETTNIDLQFIAAKDEYGVSPAYTSFTFKMKDADNVVSEKPYTVTVKVNPVNDKPIAHDTVYTINENVAAGTAAAGKIRMEDVDDTQFTYAFDTNDPKYTTVSSIFAINATTGAITVKNAGLDYEGLNADTTMVIKVIVTDVASTTSGSGKLADTSVVTIKVVDVNEAPVVRDTTFTVDENSPAGTEVGTLQAFDPDIRNPHFGTLSFTIVENTNSSNADDVPFSIAPDGTITVSVDDALDFETKPTWVINVKVTDGTYTETVKVTINLNDLNEPPH
ncbi:MAG: cadherin repeat domain-containing protein, partial [Bacteroidales bacterium]|nr:cadherin repeat domain-containing protein [Bacteroidales bacterium]